MYDLYVGIDVAKGTSSAHGLDGGGSRRFTLTFRMDSEGFAALLGAIEASSDDVARVAVAMESTACYHMNLFSYLTAKGMHVVIVNPLLISNFVKLSLRKTKTDKKDALVIAQFLLMNCESLGKSAVTADIADLRDLARQRESLVDQMTSIKSDAGRLLSITFPELESIAGLFTKSMLRLLSRYPSAEAIRKASVTSISKIIIPGSYGKNTLETVRRIKEAAETSVGTSSRTKEMVLKQKAGILMQLDEHLKEITSVLMERCREMMIEDMEILKSVQGIGDKTSVNFLLEMGGDIRHYKSHKKLIAMAGLDPSVYQSGKYEGSSRISKRGNRHLRRVIWLMAVKVIQFESFFKEYYLKRREDGLPYKKAVLATAHKLIRILFAMLTKKTRFSTEASS